MIPLHKTYHISSVELGANIQPFLDIGLKPRSILCEINKIDNIRRFPLNAKIIGNHLYVYSDTTDINNNKILFMVVEDRLWDLAKRLGKT